jgi:hypothetical protein
MSSSADIPWASEAHKLAEISRTAKLQQNSTIPSPLMLQIIQSEQ